MVQSLRGVSLILILLLALGVLPARAATPTEEVKQVIDEVLAVLSDPDLGSPGQRKQRRRLIKQAIDRRFDYGEMARRSLAQHWRALSPAQREEFVRLFSELLERSYGDKFEAYAGGETVTYLSERRDGDHAEVRTVLVRPNDKIPMNYSLYYNSGQWMIYDVVIEGVSLVSNYRSQFQTIIRQSSYEGLVSRLRARLEELRKIDKL